MGNPENRRCSADRIKAASSITILKDIQKKPKKTIKIKQFKETIESKS